MTQEGYGDLVRRMAPDRIFLMEPMSRHTSFRVGGPVDALVCPGAAGEIAAVLDWCRRREIPRLIMGNGTNLLIRDGGFRGVVVKLSERFRGVSVSGNRVTAQAGASLAAVARAARRASLSGLEFAAGIPGTVGGAVAMNAGAYGGAMADVTGWAEVLDAGGEVRRIDGRDMGFGYRRSRLQDEEMTALSVELELIPGDGAGIQARMDELAARRMETQPLTLPSAGSVFKRPPGGYAGRLVEEAGLKGARVGGAQVSPKHAGFIVNLGGATAADILTLMDRVAGAVERRTGIRLEPEVRILGEDV